MRRELATLTVAVDCAPVAQGIEHPPPKRGAASSILAGRATFQPLPLRGFGVILGLVRIRRVSGATAGRRAAGNRQHRGRSGP